MTLAPASPYSLQHVLECLSDLAASTNAQGRRRILYYIKRGQVLISLSGCVVYTKRNGIIHIVFFGIKKAHQGKGLGRDLFDAFLRTGGEDFKAVTCDVYRLNHSEGFWVKMGFVKKQKQWFGKTMIRTLAKETSIS